MNFFKLKPSKKEVKIICDFTTLIINSKNNKRISYKELDELSTLTLQMLRK